MTYSRELSFSVAPDPNTTASATRFSTKETLTPHPLPVPESRLKSGWGRGN